MTIERCLLDNTAKHLRHHDNVRGAIGELTRNPEIIQTRVQEFETCLSVLSSYMGDRSEWKSNRKYLDPDLFKNLLAFKTTHHDLQLGSIAVASHMSVDGGRVNDVVNNTFEAIAGYADKKEWQFVTETTDSGRLASGLLIEGYGELLEQIHEKQGLARDFVLAFEEVLASDLPDSEMFRDIKPWMIAERNKFGDGLVPNLLPLYSPVI